MYRRRWQISIAGVSNKGIVVGQAEALATQSSQMYVPVHIVEKPSLD